ncbi:MAG: exodeoxyribonuclease VII small subunit [Phycisphaerae bacterium]|nr:exodeoxyribonuclease VII small subunit [Phycisphaerae bacterium]
MAAERKSKDDLTKLTFEQAIGQLREIVNKIEQGQIPLQDSLDQYEKGMALIKHCRDILQKAEKRIEKISKEEPPESPEEQEEDAEPF